MTRKSVIAVAFASLLFGALCANAMGTKRAAPELPIGSVSVTLRRDALEKIFTELETYAEQNAFALRIARSGPNPEDVLIQMWRADIKAMGVNATDTGAREITLGIGFYQNEERYPTFAAPGLIENLRSFLEDLEGVVSVRVE